MTDETKQDDPIIELTDVVEDGEDMEQTLSDDIFSDDEMPDENLVELMDVDDFNEIEDIEKAVAAGEISAPDEISVSDEKIETALERVIEKKFAEKIEPLLFETMERVILQEIQKIKTTLLKDMDRIDPH
ncbi:MAG: hypothetical protein ACQEQ5_07930 [Thermodesulfobacteriota bacterium]